MAGWSWQVIQRLQLRKSMQRWSMRGWTCLLYIILAHRSRRCFYTLQNYLYLERKLNDRFITCHQCRDSQDQKNPGIMVSVYHTVGYRWIDVRRNLIATGQCGS